MQTSTIQRPQLFTQCLDTEIMWNNEYLTYIKTSIHKATMKVTSTLRDFTIKTKNQLKAELKKLSLVSKKLFENYSENKQECRNIDIQISKIHKDYKDAPDTKQYINDKFEKKRFLRNHLRSNMFQTKIKYCKQRMKTHPPLTDEDCIAF